MLKDLAVFVGSRLGLPKLEENIHIMVFSTIFFHAAYLFGGFLSNLFAKEIYGDLSSKAKIVWRVKIVSFFHAIVICALAFPLMFDPVLLKDKVFGYTPYSGAVYAVTCGYFIWDIVYVLIQGQHVSFLFHGIACLSVYVFSFSPFLNYYGSVFLMFELSTPFLNIGYFMDKCSMKNSLYFKVNSFMLLSVFFLVRICYGLYMSYSFFVSVSEVHETIPVHLLALYGTANIALNILNQLWFIKLVSLLLRKSKPVMLPSKMPLDGPKELKKNI